MKYYYILNFEKNLIKQLEEGTSVFQKKQKLHLFYRNENLYKGINQIILTEKKFNTNLQTLHDRIFFNKKLNKKNVLIEQKINNKINYNFVFNDKKIKQKKIKKIKYKDNYNFFEIEDVLNYFFIASINNDIYLPFLTNEETKNLINFIKNNPTRFSYIANLTFERLIGETK